MVYQRLTFQERTSVPQAGELVDDLRLDCFVIGHILNFGIGFDLDRKLHDIVSLINETLVAVCSQLELDGNVTPVDASL